MATDRRSLERDSPSPSRFDELRACGIVRPDDDRWVAGVCAGIARYWGVDPVLVRGLLVVTSLAFGAGMFVYGLAWLLLPQPDGRIHAEAALHNSFTSGFAAAALATVVGFGDLTSGPGNGKTQVGGVVATLALLGAALWWWWRSEGGSRSRGDLPQNQPLPPPSVAPAAPPSTDPGQSLPASPSTNAASNEPVTMASDPHADAPTEQVPAWGTAPRSAAYVPYGAPAPSRYPATAGAEPAYGTAHQGMQYRRPDYDRLKAQTDRVRPARRPVPALRLGTLGLAILIGVVTTVLTSPAVGIAGALGVIGIGIVISGLLGHRSGLAGLAVILSLITAGNIGAVEGPGSPGAATNAVVNDRIVAPETAAAANVGFSGGAGNLTVDLSTPALAADLAHQSTMSEMSVTMLAGDITVLVPPDVPLLITATTRAGTISNEIDGTTTDGANIRTEARVGSAPEQLAVRIVLLAGTIDIRRAGEPGTGMPSPSSTGAPASGASSGERS